MREDSGKLGRYCIRIGARAHQPQADALIDDTGPGGGDETAVEREYLGLKADVWSAQSAQTYRVQVAAEEMSS